MIAEFIAAVFTALVITPIQTEVTERLDALGASAEIVQQSRACLTSAGPALLERATNDPWWAGTTVVGLTFGTESPAALLNSASPDCAPVAAYIATEQAES